MHYDQHALQPPPERVIHKALRSELPTNGQERDSMAITATAPTSNIGSIRNTTDVRAMSIATVLFFMWGLLTSLNDILIPHL
jgi:hypothetical protein